MIDLWDFLSIRSEWGSVLASTKDRGIPLRRQIVWLLVPIIEEWSGV